ncbi:acyltransferase family protein [Novosphingobium capsulatum]|uniref:acyltransferase family protein n=1 Tax=Novosphingobium capsulatum TaxID=13688 RepID=UPI00142F3819|nr:acyltransferase [Novosphingobium capsulatum]WQD92775.1 acyltransferase [Novosphingobium capsulatum]
MVLDGLRGVAALSVVIFHRRWLAPGGHAFDHGFLAVNFFFILSGFVIDHAYTDRLAKGMTLANFALRRVIRLYPLIVAGAVLGLLYALALAHLHHEPESYWRYTKAAFFNMFCLPSPAGLVEGPFIINRPTWSLFFELIANIAFALLFCRFSNRVLWIALAIIAPILMYVTFKFGTINVGFEYGELIYGLPIVLTPFIIGILISRYMYVVTGPALPFWLSSAMLIAIFQIPVLPGLWGPIYHISLMLIGFPLIILASTRTQPAGFWLKAAQFGGFISYPLYALHYPILQFVSGFGEMMKIPNAVTLIGVVIASIVTAWVAARIYDEPVRAWLESRLLRKSRQHHDFAKSKISGKSA